MGEETDPFIGWNPLTGSPILKYSHRNRTDTRPVSFLYPPSLRYLLPISTPFFPYISFSPLPSLRIDELRSGLQGRKRKDTIPSFSRNRILTRRTTIRDFSRLSKIPARIISSVSPLQFQTVWNNDKSEERERERICYWRSVGFVSCFDERISKRMINYH